MPAANDKSLTLLRFVGVNYSLFEARDQIFNPRRNSPKIEKCIPSIRAFQTDVGPLGQNPAVFKLQEPNFSCVVGYVSFALSLTPFEFAEQVQPNMLGVEDEQRSLSGEKLF